MASFPIKANFKRSLENTFEFKRDFEENMIQIRQALQSEIDWVNACYEEVDFRPSSFDKEIIAIAEYKGQKAGLGRLVSIDSNTLELGGMICL